MKTLLLFCVLLINTIAFSQEESFQYKGTIGTVKTELALKLTISKDGCIYAFEGNYFNKKLNKDLQLKATLNPCKNDKENPDEKITLNELDGETITGTFVLNGIGEHSCYGTWISPNGKKKLPVKFLMVEN
jgi:hypothetical protein